MQQPPLVTAAWAHHWLAAHAGQRALARPLVVLVGAPLAPLAPPALAKRARPPAMVREGDVAAQGRRVFGNWRRLARVATDDRARAVRELVAALGAEADDAVEDDAFDLVAFDDAATRVRALPADLPPLGRAHHVLLVNARRTGLERWLGTDSREPAPAVVLFPARPGRPPASGRAREVARPPRVRTVCSIRPARAGNDPAATVTVTSRWRDEPVEGAPQPAATRARWTRGHTAIALATVFAQLAEVEAGSPAAIRY